MVPRIRDPDELAAAFAIQRKAILASCEAYDAGEHWEAIRIATAVCVFVHDGGKNNRSMLTQMGVKASMRFLASGHLIRPGNFLADTPLVILQVGRGVQYLPRLAENPRGHRLLSFGEWWERDLIFQGRDKTKRLTRKKLAFALRNQEGGSHFDKVILDPNYAEMTHGKGWIAVAPDGTQRPLRELELASMRQVGWELLQSLEKAGLV